MELSDLTKRALEIRAQYDQLNEKKGQPTWTGQDFMAGFVGDVGELSEIIMAKHGLRSMDDIDAKLAHELSDCLWSILVLADKYDIDLAAEFTKTMDSLEKRIAEKGR